MDISVFEVMGPVMMGPSSSGTAGMYRLGAAARQFFQDELRAVDLKFTPRLGPGYLGCRSHFGLLGGILGMEAAGVVKKLRSHLPDRFAPATGEIVADGVIFDIDEASGRTTALRRISF